MASGEQTTGDVAGWLEDKYHVMGAFFAANEQKVADALASSMAGSMENQLLGGPAGGEGEPDGLGRAFGGEGPSALHPLALRRILVVSGPSG